ncbi:Rv0804 family intramembrane glutamic endopeptidase [Mycolicibacterium komossense]|uniref:CPBP family intramembrane metalloprotease n=1 Tax=Mycolicibacterium komossense TaxID=1779 RepID=A0ABT3CMB4_9MYCO|nr:CPBP family intramembrane glutamic endopeptidase [Mycolicibacterium komossense]MCV7230597.1 CPBP family intramembrane metalloprotease [Mycolicibacterium komossense]
MDGRPIALAGLLVGYSATAGLAIPGRRHPIVQAALGSALAALAGAQPGLDGDELRSGLGFGMAAAAVVAAGVGVGAAIPAVRAGMAARALPRPAWKWLLVDIPIGTVWAEEASYRGALETVAAGAYGPVMGRLVQAVAFGLSHVPDARGAGEPVLGTIVVTGTAGWIFGWLATSSGSLIAPVLAHLAINEVGAVVALLVQRRRQLAAAGC